MQIKYGFKKEWLLSIRTFRLFGILIALFSFALADPLMYKVLGVMMETMGTEFSSMDTTGMDAAMMDATAAMSDAANAMSEAANAMSEAANMFNNAGLIFSVVMTEFCATGLIIIMLILMAPAGGEQKKRATIIPACSGLKYFDYLIPKFVFYPLLVLVSVFLACMTGGGLCNLLFTEGHIAIDMMLLGSAMCAVFMFFMTSVYMGVGLCTSRPGITTIFIYIGMNLMNIIFSSLELTKYHPFSLLNLVTGQMFNSDFVLAEHTASIIVAIALSFVIAVLMFALTNAVLNMKKINNQEDKPEF